MDSQLITTADRSITVKGRVFYNDGRRRIDLKKPIRDLFEKPDSDIEYTMEFCLSEHKLVNRIRELAGLQITPVIIYFREKIGGDEDEVS